MIFDVTPSSEKTFDRPVFMNFDFGQHIVRLLHGSAELNTAPKKIYTHFINRGYITLKCIGEECPICTNNKKLMSERPNDFNKAPGFIPRLERHYINALDRTLVKTCPECGTETKRDVLGKFPPVCRKCEKFINDVIESPSNVVKVLNLSKTNAEIINSYNSSVVDNDGNPLGVLNFDIGFLVIKAGDKKNINPVPQIDRKDKIEVPDELLHNLDSCVITLNASEIIGVQSGVSLRDIFIARREEVPMTTEESSYEIKQQVSEKIKNLFGD